MVIECILPEKFLPLYEPARYKVFYGGRGGAKSHTIAEALINLSLQRKLRIGCFREFQNSIKDSAHKLISDKISSHNLSHHFSITESSIRCLVTGSEFLFKGLHRNILEIKSLEGIDIAWIEEAQNVSDQSWNILIPTIRKEGSEIWVSFNPYLQDDATYRRFVLNPPPGAVVVKVNYYDNPCLPATLKTEMQHCKDHNPDDYAHIWLGECLTFTDAQIFKGKFEICNFDVELNPRWFLGIDWGFSKDPTALTASYIKDDCLYVAFEAGGVGIELDEIPLLLKSFPIDTKRWPLKADNSRPETINYIQKKGYRIEGAKKWGGSVEDGIAYLKNFKKIYIHETCRKTAEEFRLYSYKVDKNNGDILPIITGKHNHYIDSIRYGLDGYITSKPTFQVSKEMVEAAKNAVRKPYP